MPYYIIYNNTQQGPMNKEELVKYGLNYNSDVWTEGLPAWVKASEIAELKVFIDNLNAPQKAEDDYYFMIVNNQQVGPYAIDELLHKGLQTDTQVWKSGMNNWTPAGQIPELQKLFSPQTPPPFANHQAPLYAPGQNIYNNQQYIPTHTNWMPWAVASTVLGFLCSCIGCIFGIIAIVKANDANNHYKEGHLELAQKENSMARTMTIIAIASTILGIIVSIIYTILALL